MSIWLLTMSSVNRRGCKYIRLHHHQHIYTMFENFIISMILMMIVFLNSDPIQNTNSNDRATVQSLLEKLILEEDQFDVHDILPNTVPDPASLILESDYACPVGQVVMAPDCGKLMLF